MAVARVCLFLQIVVAFAGRDWLAPFQRLQVSAPMVVHVITDTSRHNADLDIAADSMGLGWTVQSEVQPMTFGSTLLLGMDARAVRQQFAWPAGGQMATLTVPEPLQAVSVTGGAKVLVDIVTGDLAADSKSNLTVPPGRCKSLSQSPRQKLNSSANSSHLFIADDANITVRSGVIGSAYIQAWHGAVVDLWESKTDAILNIKVDSNSSVVIKAEPAAPPKNATPVANVTANSTATNHTNGTMQPSNASMTNSSATNGNSTAATSNALTANVTQNGTGNATKLLKDRFVVIP